MLSTKLAPIARKSCLSLSYRTYATAPAPTLHPADSGLRPPHLLTLADLSVPQIQNLIDSAVAFKKYYKSKAIPKAGQLEGAQFEKGDERVSDDVKRKSLDSKTVALIFSKRSTRTRVASETAIQSLGELSPLFDSLSFPRSLLSSSRRPPDVPRFWRYPTWGQRDSLRQCSRYQLDGGWNNGPSGTPL